MLLRWTAVAVTLACAAVVVSLTLSANFVQNYPPIRTGGRAPIVAEEESVPRLEPAGPQRLAASVTTADFGRIQPDTAGECSFIVYSQTWSDLSLEVDTTALPQAQSKMEAVEPDVLHQFDATAATRVVLTLPSEMPAGDLTGVLQLRATQATPIDALCSHTTSEAEATIKDDANTDGVEAAEAETAVLDLPISGKVLRRLAIYGDDMDDEGRIYLGTTPEGEAASTYLLLKVRDPHRELPNIRVECTPAFLRAAVTPSNGREDGRGMYRLTIEVPANAPACNYLGNQPATVRIITDHPQIPETSFNVFFAVAGQPLRAVKAK